MIRKTCITLILILVGVSVYGQTRITVNQINDSMSIARFHSDSLVFGNWNKYDISPDSMVLGIVSPGEKTVTIRNQIGSIIKVFSSDADGIAIGNNGTFVLIKSLVAENGSRKTKVGFFSQNGQLVKDSIFNGGFNAKFMSNGKLMATEANDEYGLRLPKAGCIVILFASNFEIIMVKEIENQLYLKASPIYDEFNQWYSFSVFSRGSNPEEYKVTIKRYDQDFNEIK